MLFLANDVSNFFGINALYYFWFNHMLSIDNEIIPRKAFASKFSSFHLHIIFFILYLIMANLSLINILPDRVAVQYIQLKRIMSKMHRTSSSIAFIKKAIYNDITPVFAKVKGQFINKNNQLKSEKLIMKSHLASIIEDLTI